MKGLKNLNNWIKNDPDPVATLKLIKQKLDYRKQLSRTDPVKLMRLYMPKDEWDAYWREKKIVEASYVSSKGWAKKEKDQFDMKHVAMIPQLVYNSNVEYWSEIIKTRQFHKHPEFLVSNPFTRPL
jgi:hypothetical protein